MQKKDCAVLCVCAGLSVVLCACGGGSTRGGTSVFEEAGASVRDIRRETFSKGSDTYPNVSPSGKEFAYQRYQDDNYDIWAKLTTSVSDSAGRQITFHRADDRRPSWLNDEMIVFDSWRVDTNKLWRKRASGSGGTTLISRGNHVDLDPDVSPGGSVVFVSQVKERIVLRDERGKLWKMFTQMPTIWKIDPDGAMTMLANGISPAWSPDGSQIAFAANREGNFDIYIMDADGGNQTQLTTNEADDIEPCWSPDGLWLAFSSSRSSGRRLADFNIWAIHAIGGSLTQLTIHEDYDGAPSWAKGDDRYPGGRIYFHSYRNRDWDIWSIAPLLD